MLPTRAVKGNAGTRTVQIVQYRRFQTDSRNYSFKHVQKGKQWRDVSSRFLHKVRLDKSIIRDSILNGYKTICLGVACSEIFWSPELRKREHENKTSFLFSSPPLFTYLLLSRLPHYLRAWNRLQLAWVYIILNVDQIYIYKENAVSSISRLLSQRKGQSVLFRLIKAISLG